MGVISVARMGTPSVEPTVYFSITYAKNSSRAANWERESCIADNPCFQLPESYETVRFLCGHGSSWHRGEIVKDVMTLDGGDDGSLIMLDSQRRIRCMGDEIGAIMYALVT